MDRGESAALVVGHGSGGRDRGQRDRSGGLNFVPALPGSGVLAIGLACLMLCVES
jgi:hypothetical protein